MTVRASKFPLHLFVHTLNGYRPFRTAKMSFVNAISNIAILKWTNSMCWLNGYICALSQNYVRIDVWTLEKSVQIWNLSGKQTQSFVLFSRFNASPGRLYRSKCVIRFDESNEKSCFGQKKKTRLGIATLIKPWVNFAIFGCFHMHFSVIVGWIFRHLYTILRPKKHLQLIW